MKNHETIQTIDQTIIIITIVNATFPITEILITETDKKNYFQSPHRFNTQEQNSQQNYRSSTPKHQRQINQI